MPTKTESFEAVRDLFEKLRSDEALRAKVSGVRSYQELVRVAKDAGFDLSGISEADLRGLAAGGRGTSGELDDADLAAVSGGQFISSAISQVIKNFGAALQSAARG